MPHLIHVTRFRFAGYMCRGHDFEMHRGLSEHVTLYNRFLLLGFLSDLGLLCFPPLSSRPSGGRGEQGSEAVLTGDRDPAWLPLRPRYCVHTSAAVPICGCGASARDTWPAEGCAVPGDGQEGDDFPQYSRGLLCKGGGSRRREKKKKKAGRTPGESEACPRHSLFGPQLREQPSCP